jgi:capsular exopolysaccharide synthesis family protein
MKEISPYITSRRGIAPADRHDRLFDDGPTVYARDLWVALLKYRWTAAIFLCLSVCAALGWIVSRPPVYTATATVHIQSDAPNLTGVQGPFALGVGSGVLATNYDYYQTQFRLLQSRTLAARVIRELNLADDPRFVKPDDQGNAWWNPTTWPAVLRGGLKSGIEWLRSHLGQTPTIRVTGDGGGFELGVHPDLISRYLKMLDISPVRKSQLVDVTFMSEDPTLSREVANAHAAAFIRMNLQTRFELTAEARDFLQEKLAELKAKVEKSEQALNRFRESNKIFSLDKGENIIVDRLMRLNTELTTARAKRIELESLVRTVKRGNERLLSQIINNRYIQQLKDQITALEADYARLATKFKPSYPRLLALQDQLDQARGRLNRELVRIARTIESDHAAALANERALAAELEQERKAALALQKKAVEYRILEREAESDRTLYESVLKRSKETDLAREVPVSNMYITDRAEIPLRPESTGATLLLGLSLLGGLLGGIGLAFSRHYFDSSLKTPEDVGDFLLLPTLGVVPDMERMASRRNGKALGFHETGAKGGGSRRKKRGGGAPDKGKLVVSHHPASLIAECYRGIRTALYYSQPEAPPQTIVITSAQAREGKTLTAVNLAISLAQNGGQVLLVDADLRNGYIHRLLGVNNGAGLTNILVGMGEPESFIRSTAVRGLHFLSRGEPSLHPAELLGSEKMRLTLETLRERYAFVVIDSAPVLPISDTLMVAPKVDGVLLVARGQAVSRHVVRKACDRLDFVQARILGVVLNGVDLWSPEYGQYRSSYVSYYSNYAKSNEQAR